MRILIVTLALAIASVPLHADVLPPKKKKDPANIVQPSEPWWDVEHVGWLGGLVGGTVGILGGVIGTLAGLGRARTFVLPVSLALACAGASTLLAGIIAVSTGQPDHVYYPLLVFGFVCSFVFGINYPGIKRRFEVQQTRERYASSL